MPKTRARSAVSGEFVTKEKVAEEPETTVTETIADPDALLDHLESLRGAVDDECEGQPDQIKAALGRIAQGIVSLRDARSQVKTLSRDGEFDV